MLKNLENYKVILASGSPRRQQFLKEMGINFEIKLKDIEEVYPNDLKAQAITNYLAELKANAFDGEILDNEILITSDTIVWLNNEALGKPKDYDDAFNMLKKMMNKTHQVITSVCVKTIKKTTTFHEITHVTFSNLIDDDLHFYLENYKPFDKAGSYGIQDWIGLAVISKIEGSYTNVVGLPTEKLYHFLCNF